MTTYQAVLFFMFAGWSPAVALIMYGGAKLQHYPDSRKYFATVVVGRLLLGIPIAYGAWHEFSDLGILTIFAVAPLWPIGFEHLCRDIFGFSFVDAWNLKDGPGSAWDLAYLVAGAFIMFLVGMVAEDRGDRED